MNEVTAAKGLTDAPTKTSIRLTREVGLMAGHLAHFLAGSMPNAEGVMAEGQAFLWAMYEMVSDGQPLESWPRDARARGLAAEPHPLDRLTSALSLSPVEIELLLLAGLSEEHEGLAAVLRSLHPREEPRASVGLAAQLLCRDPHQRHSFRELIETSAAVRAGALRIVGDAPFFERSLLLADALWSTLHGIDAWPLAVARLDVTTTRSGLDEWLATKAATLAIEAIRRSEACTVMMTAESEDATFHRACALVAHAGAEPMGILLPASPEPGLEKLIQVQALVRGATPVMKLAAADGQPVSELPSFSSFPGVIVACGRTGVVGVRNQRPLITVPIERLTPASRRKMWRETVPELAGQATQLAARHPVEPAVASAVAADLNFIATLESRPPEVKDVATSIRARGSVSLSVGVRLVHPYAAWENLVLSADRLRQLHEAVARLEWQSRVFDEWGFLKDRAGARGVRLLFAGAPGTGKTLSAEVLAHALGVDLLIVDLSRVVSKWIGETEKNLAAVFDAAERAQAALFFDEADALFGKRTEVSDAHDRYANLETAYLLTRLEQCEGLAILATNLRQNIDPAFLRRLEFVIDFEEPDRAERLALWCCHLPKDAPLDADVNLPELAAIYPVVGGVIRNAIVAAAFLAAEKNVPIARRHIIHALRREYEKTGRSFPGPYTEALV